MNLQYILDENGDPIECNDIREWGAWMQSNDRRISQTEIGESKVSTVFLGLDHAWDGGSPLLWETMVFEGPFDGEMKRCGGKIADAQAMHDAMCERIRNPEK